MSNLFDRIRLVESNIDYPQESLDTSVWDLEGESHTLKHDVKRKVLNFISKYPFFDMMEFADEMRITGSITTNQFTPTVDLDVHIVPKDLDGFNQEQAKTVMDWFDENRNELAGYIEEHPIEVYIQLDPDQDLRGDGAYEMLQDEWLLGPKIVPTSYDPYDDFSHVSDDLREMLSDLDAQLGELSRDVIDHETIRIAMEKMPEEDRKKLGARLEAKLVEIEDTIKELYATRKEWVQARQDASNVTAANALKDVQRVKKWQDENAYFKFLDRYQYLSLIKELSMLLADDDTISDDDVAQIRNTLMPRR